MSSVMGLLVGHGFPSKLMSSSVGGSKISKLMMLGSVLMLSGIPPFGVFMGKVEVLAVSVEEGLGLVGGMMVVMSSVMMMVYMKMIISVMVSESGKVWGGKGVVMVVMMAGILPSLPWWIW